MNNTASDCSLDPRPRIGQNTRPMTKPLESLIAEVDQIARTACCAWEAHAARNRGDTVACERAARVVNLWAFAARAVSRSAFRQMRVALDGLAVLEIEERQAPHSARAVALIREYQRSQEPC